MNTRNYFKLFLLISLPTLAFASTPLPTSLDSVMPAAKEEAKKCQTIEKMAGKSIATLRGGNYQNKALLEKLLESAESAPSRAKKNVDALNLLDTKSEQIQNIVPYLEQLNPMCRSFANFIQIQDAFEFATQYYSDADKLRVAKIGVNSINEIMSAKTPILMEALITLKTASLLSHSGYLKKSKYASISALSIKGEHQRGLMADRFKISGDKNSRWREEFKLAKNLATQLRSIIGRAQLLKPKS